MTNEANPRPPQEPRSDRRQFFLRGLSKTLEGLLGAAEKVSPIPLQALIGKPPRRVLRPPGALAEDEFLKTCYRCGSCVDACRVHAIRPLQSQDAEEAGTPYLDPDLQACELCSNWPCVQACPSGALARASQDGTARAETRLGLAKWDKEQCLRTAGQTCQACIERCPVGLMTVHLNSQGQIEILEDQCLGCGVCQQVCPARPKAIHVLPL